MDSSTGKKKKKVVEIQLMFTDKKRENEVHTKGTMRHGKPQLTCKEHASGSRNPFKAD